jgi:hypothetical protein
LFNSRRSDAELCSNKCAVRRHRRRAADERKRAAAALSSTASLLTDWQASLDERGLSLPTDLTPGLAELVAFARDEARRIGMTK